MKVLFSIAIVLLLAGCQLPLSENDRYPADTGERILVTNVVGGVTNIGELHLGP